MWTTTQRSFSTTKTISKSINSNSIPIPKNKCKDIKIKSLISTKKGFVFFTDKYYYRSTSTNITEVLGSLLEPKSIKSIWNNENIKTNAVINLPNHDKLFFGFDNFIKFDHNY